MTVELLSVNDIKNIRIAEYIVDTEIEKDSVPIEDKVFGTKCYVVESGKNYRLNSDLEWVEENEVEDGGGGSAPSTIVQSIIITRNGTTTAPNGKAYSPIVVNIEGADEAEEKDVNFIDYDGKILYSYTAEQFLNLNTLPVNPSHEGLVAQGWNWTLNDAKAQVSNSRRLIIGQNYTTSDGATKIKVHLNEGRLSPYLHLWLEENVEATIDWGDNSTPDVIIGKGFDMEDDFLNISIYTQHNYSTPGEYVISILTDGVFKIPAWGSSALLLSVPGFATSAVTYYCYLNTIEEINLSSNCIITGLMCDCMMGLKRISIPNNGVFENLEHSYSIFDHCHELKSIVLPPNMTYLPYILFASCYKLKRISVPKQATTYGEKVFGSCYSLEDYVIPDSVTSIDKSCFSDCYLLKNIYISDNLHDYPQQFLKYCWTLPKLIIGNNVETLGESALYQTGIGELHFMSSIPPVAASSNTFFRLSDNCKIYVPAGSLSAYTSATNYPSSDSYTYIEE